ncbi:MAG: geranylgeranylglyceryl/heptaprenylglyceryl phosphate synthase [Candidatus Aenigmatarchaeota archaeon]
MLGKVEQQILDSIEKDGAIFLGLIDPMQDMDKSIRFAKAFHEAGADLLLMGGSLGINQQCLNETAKRIKETVPTPILLFPGNVDGLTPHADAIYYMCLMNSTNPYWITGAHALSAFAIKQMGTETIPTSLIIVEPGETVGWVGDAKPVPLHKPEIAASYALAGKMMGHRLTILERGSGAPGPSPPEMFSLVKKTVGHPVICAGSQKSYQDIEKTLLGGADGVQVASLIQKAPDPEAEAKKLVAFVKEIGKKKIQRR